MITTLECIFLLTSPVLLGSLTPAELPWGSPFKIDMVLVSLLSGRGTAEIPRRDGIFGGWEADVWAERTGRSDVSLGLCCFDKVVARARVERTVLIEKDMVDEMFLI